MAPDNPTGSERQGFPEGHSLWRWYLNWRYEVLEPLRMLSGFSELLLKDINGTLNKPLKDDEKRKFLEIVLNKAKSVQRALDLLEIYLGLREHGRNGFVVWEGKSVTEIVEKIVDELQNEKKFVRVVLNKNDTLPLIRTSESTLRSALTILLEHIPNPEQKEWEILINFEVPDDSFVSMEIITSFYRSSWESLTIEQLYDEPPNHLLMSKLLVEALDGRFDAFIKDKKLMHKILLPIWWLPETVDRIVRVQLEAQSVELFLGQQLEVIKILEKNVGYDISLIEIVECDRNVIVNIARGSAGQEGIYELSFASTKVGSTNIKLRYSPPSIEPIFYDIYVTVKPQTPNIE